MVDDVRKRLEVGLRADTAAKALSDTLFRKARWDWPAPRAVLVAPDGPLWRIPMDVLPIPESGTRLGELAPVVTIPSASVLLDMHRLESTPAAMHFLGVVHAGTSSEIKLDRAAREVTAICEVLEDCSARTVLGGDSPLPATRENLIRYLPTATHVHLAAHASADDAGGVEPHILISDGKGGDARLEASAIENLHLSRRNSCFSLPAIPRAEGSQREKG